MTVRLVDALAVASASRMSKVGMCERGSRFMTMETLVVASGAATLGARKGHEMGRL
jgi:hypothetical protein